MLSQPPPESHPFTPHPTMLFLLQTFHPVASQAGDPRRPLSSCHFSPDGNMVATTSWSGTVAVRLLVYALTQHRAAAPVD